MTSGDTYGHVALSFHHQLLDYCLQAKKMLCLICLSQTVSVACISICYESLDLQ